MCALNEHLNDPRSEATFREKPKPRSSSYPKNFRLSGEYLSYLSKGAVSIVKN